MEYNLVKELRVEGSIPPPECPSCDEQLHMTFNVPPNVHYKGVWFKTEGKY
jgi:hypothetical protein